MKRNYTLNGLRGLCALCIIVSHTYGMAVIGGLFPNYGEFSFGDISVYLFFAISSYIIIQSLLRKRSIWQFFKDRIIRLYPVFLVLHIALFTVGVLGYDYFDSITTFGEYAVSFMVNLLMLAPLLDYPIAQKNSWTLTFQFIFYILASFTVLLPKKFANTLWSKTVLAASLILIALFAYQYPVPFSYFLLGILAYYIVQYKRVPLYRDKPVFQFNGLLLFILMGFFYFVHPLLTWITGAAFFITIIREEGFLSKLLRTKLFQFFGNISYSFYLLHPFVLFAIRIVLTKYEHLFPNSVLLLVVFFVMGLIITTIVSYFSYRIIEVWLTNTYLKRKTTVTTPGSAKGAFAVVNR